MSPVLELAAEADRPLDPAWRVALEAEGGAALVRLVALVGDRRTPADLTGWSTGDAARIRGIGPGGTRLRQIRRAARRVGVDWGADLEVSRPRGRPRGRTTERTASLTVRLSAADLARLSAAAEAEGVSRSEWIRRRIPVRALA